MVTHGAEAEGSAIVRGDESVAGILGDRCPLTLSEAEWLERRDRATPTTDLVSVAIAATVHLSSRTSEMVGLIAAAGLMVVWLDAMPLRRGSVWCAETHALATLLQFGMTFSGEGFDGGKGFVRESIAEAFIRTITGTPDIEALGFWAREVPTEAVDLMESDPRIADLAFVMSDVAHQRQDP